MSKHHEIISELDAYCERVGVEPSTVCRKATGNPRLRDRLIARIKRTESDVAALRAFMSSDPVSNELSE